MAALAAAKADDATTNTMDTVQVQVAEASKSQKGKLVAKFDGEVDGETLEDTALMNGDEDDEREGEDEGEGDVVMGEDSIGLEDGGVEVEQA